MNQTNVRTRKPFSIVGSLTISLTCIVAVISILSSVSFFLDEMNKAKKQSEEKADESILYLSSILEIPLWNLDDQTAGIIGKTFFQDQAVTSLEITGNNGTVVFRMSREGSTDLARWKTITHLGAEIGSVRIDLSYRQLFGRVVEFFTRMAITDILVILSLVFLTGFLIRVYLKNPLAYLTDIVNAYSSENYSAKASEIPIAEFKPLGRVLEDMATRIIGQIRDLRVLNAELEKSSSEKDTLIGEIRISEEKFSKTFKSNPAAIAITDTRDGKLIETNQSLELLLGYSRGELIGRTTVELGIYVDPKDRDAVFGIVEHGERLKDKEMLLRRKDGRVVNARFSAEAIELDGVPCILSSIIDETDKVSAQERLRASLNEKDALLRELYHRTKNNMQVMSSLLEIHADRSDDPRTSSALRDMESRIDSMALVHEKLYESRNLSKISLDEYLRDLVELLVRSYSIPSRTVSLALELSEVEVSIDTALPCGLLVTELLSNSLKHAFAGMAEGVIRVSLRSAADDEIEIAVSDNGVGFADGFEWETSDSMGLETIVALGRDQLQGKIGFESKDGVTFRINFRDFSRSSRF